MYAKVFAQIYDGTLCTYGPWQALVTFQQFLVLADQEGVVDMTAAAIARRTTIPLEIIDMGIKALLKPDPESRTPTEEGRRLVPLSEGRPWGWRVVNYKHYRALKREGDRREYHRDYWHKRKELTQHTQHTQPNQPIAEAEAEAEAIKTLVTQASRFGDASVTKHPRSSDATDGGFVEFWNAWPNHKRKAAKKQCALKWMSLGCAHVAGQVLDALKAAKLSVDWTKDLGQYIPAPLVWLNQSRWEAPTQADAVAPVNRDAEVTAAYLAEQARHQRETVATPESRQRATEMLAKARAAITSAGVAA